VIDLRIHNGELVIDAGVNDKNDILRQPLHRLFIRGVLGGQYDETKALWTIPVSDGELRPLQQVLAHFAKYSVESSLDEACRALLEGADKRRTAYELVLKQGLNAKRGKVREDHAPLLKTLEVELARPLTERQVQAVNHLLVVQNGANFSVPGSGKTAVALAYFHLMRSQKIVDAILVIGPGSSFEPWEHEFSSCFGRSPRALRLAGHSRQRRRELIGTAGRYELLLTTYHSASRDVEELARLLRGRRFVLVLDESHYVKRPQGGVLAEAVLRLAPFAKRRLILTGTPMPNGLSDLWTQFTFLWSDQSPLGRSDEYLRFTKEPVAESTVDKIREQVAPLLFRVTKSQLKLPRPSFRVSSCPMAPLQSRIYLGIASRFLVDSKEAPRDRELLREWRRARVIRLLQVAANPTLLRKQCDEVGIAPLDFVDIPLGEAIDHYAKYEIPSKIALACSQAQKIAAEGRKAVIWSSFVHNLKMLADELSSLNPIVIYGAIPLLATDADEFGREDLIARFKKDSDCKVLIANPAACAESISLHMECHDAIYLDRSFNCAHYLQSLDRIHRLGLPRGVATTYHLLLSRDSIDEVVHERLKVKQKNMRAVLEGDLPGRVPGYWSEDLGDEEAVDSALVERHIRDLLSSRARKSK